MTGVGALVMLSCADVMQMLSWTGDTCYLIKSSYHPAPGTTGTSSAQVPDMIDRLSGTSVVQPAAAVQWTFCQIK